MGWMCSQLEKREMHIKFYLENLPGNSQVEDVGVDGRLIFKWILRKWYVLVMTGFM
jgi:hypothetical protein